jgi:hypothetical protein
MTRKVTAYCFRKRLLLLPYIYKLCLSQIAHINTTIHHYVDKTDTYHNRKQRKTVHYSHANGTSVLYRTMCPLSPRMLLAEQLQKRVKLMMWLVQHVCVCLKSLCTLRSQYPFVVRIVGNDVSSKVSIFFACLPCTRTLVTTCLQHYYLLIIVYTLWQDAVYSLFWKMSIANLAFFPESFKLREHHRAFRLFEGRLDLRA